MKLWLQIFITVFSLITYSQQTDFVDFKNCKANLLLSPEAKEVGGDVKYTFEILRDIDSIFIDAQNFTHIEALLENKVYHSYDDKKLVIHHPFKKGKTYRLDIGFVTHPKKAIYFIGWDTDFIISSDSDFDQDSIDKRQIWTQGQGKYTSNWLPSIDDMNDKIEFDLSITFYNEYDVIANGNLISKESNGSTTTWHYDMHKPMSSYLVALAIGKYDKKVIKSESGIPIELYYYPEDSLKLEPTYRYTKKMFDFLEEEIGVPYPWQNYKQVPVKDFLYAGMENTSLTIFSDRYVIDSTAFVDRNYVNVNAHELAHQWFGDLVTETSGTHHWLQEGFATYYALLAEKDIFGEDYYYWQLYEYAQELLEQDRAGGSTSLLDPKSSSTTFYKRGAWVLHILRKKVGDKAFRMSVKNYIEKHQFKNVETDDFISEVEAAIGQDLNEFKNIWLKTKSFKFHNLLPYLWSTNSEYSNFLELRCESKKKHCLKFLNRTKNKYFKNYVLKNLSLDILKNFLDDPDIKTRQAIAQNLFKIPLDLKPYYESFLEDPSYLTQQIALVTLWKNFPEDRSRYLNQTKNIEGFNDKNIRILWLTLALITEDYKLESKKKLYDELIGYTNASYHFEIRQNAFQYLNSIKACNDKCKQNLEQATKHPVWQFSKFAKQLLEIQNKKG